MAPIPLGRDPNSVSEKIRRTFRAGAIAVSNATLAAIKNDFLALAWSEIALED